MRGSYRVRATIVLERPASGTLTRAVVHVPAPSPWLSGRVLDMHVDLGEVSLREGGPLWVLESTEVPLRGRLSCRVEPREALVASRDLRLPVSFRNLPSGALRATALVQSADPRLRRVAEQLVVPARTVVQALTLISRFVAREVRFEPDPRRSLPVGAFETLDSAVGSSAGIAHLFAALCRAAGIPCLVVAGLAGPALDALELSAWNLVCAGGEETWPVDATRVPALFGFSGYAIPLWVLPDCGARPEPKVEILEWEGPSGEDPALSLEWSVALESTTEAPLTLDAVAVRGAGRAEPAWLEARFAWSGAGAPTAVPIHVATSGGLRLVDGSDSEASFGIATRASDGRYVLRVPFLTPPGTTSVDDLGVRFSVPGTLASARVTVRRGDNELECRF